MSQENSLHLYLARSASCWGADPPSRFRQHTPSQPAKTRANRTGASDRREGHVPGFTLRKAGAHDACSCGRRNGEAHPSQRASKAEADDILVGQTCYSRCAHRHEPADSDPDGAEGDSEQIRRAEAVDVTQSTSHERKAALHWVRESGSGAAYPCDIERTGNLESAA